MITEAYSLNEEGDQSAYALAKLAYGDAMAAAWAMPKLFGVGIAFLAIANFLSDFPAPEFIRPITPIPPVVGNILFDIITCFLITPIQVAIYQKVLQNKNPEKYEFAGTDSASAKFLIVSILASIPIELSLLEFQLPVISIILLAVGSYISVKMAMLFPAVATDEKNALLDKAWAQMEGRFWRTVWAPLITTFPWIVMTAIIFGLTEVFLQHSEFKAFATAIIAMPFTMIVATSSAAIARIYQEVRRDQA